MKKTDKPEGVNLKGREIVIGVTGSIAAYKAAELVRRFKASGAEVSCVTTPSALKFIPALTLQALSGRPVGQELFDTSLWKAAHLELAKSADAVVIAPCSANTLARLAHGVSDDLLSCLVLTTKAPVFIAPAMHETMWTHDATQKNAGICRGYGYKLIGPIRGPLAFGDMGWGRMEDPKRIVETVAQSLHGARPASKKR
jgi:phosphopantothenoylcysteine decarboxylase/phosphopantothenate--cysteine ligase